VTQATSGLSGITVTWRHAVGTAGDLTEVGKPGVGREPIGKAPRGAGYEFCSENLQPRAVASRYVAVSAVEGGVFAVCVFT
jgi:hypothetical protein